MSKQVKAIVVFVLFALLLIILVFWVQMRAAEKEKAKKQIPPAIVITQPAKTEYWQSKVQAVGTLMAIQGVTIKSTVNGVITGIFFRSGQNVKAGQPLFQINPGVDRNLVRAPFDGQLGLKEVDMGSYVRPGLKLVDIEDINPMKVQFFVPQTYVGGLSLGQTITFTVDAYPNKTFTGKIFAIDSQLDTDTRGLAVWASVPNIDNELVPGTYAKVTLYTSTEKPVVVVPQTAIGYSFTGNFVYLDVNGKAKQVPITLGERRGDDMSITSGLKAGDVVIVVGTGMQKFDNGFTLLPEGTPQYQQFIGAMNQLVSGKMTMDQLKAKQAAAAKKQPPAITQPASTSGTTK